MFREGAYNQKTEISRFVEIFFGSQKVLYGLIKRAVDEFVNEGKIKEIGTKEFSNYILRTNAGSQNIPPREFGALAGYINSLGNKFYRENIKRIVNRAKYDYEGHTKNPDDDDE